jgi:hypothetical protein
MLKYSLTGQQEVREIALKKDEADLEAVYNEKKSWHFMA